MALILYCDIESCKHRISPSEPTSILGDKLLCEACSNKRNTGMAATGTATIYMPNLLECVKRSWIGSAWRYIGVNSSPLVGISWFRELQIDKDGPVEGNLNHRFWNKGEIATRGPVANPSTILEISPNLAGFKIWKWDYPNFLFAFGSSIAALEEALDKLK